MMFLNRQDERVTFETLVSPASDAWLLLYHGLNGLGKTTLLRHLQASLSDGWVPMPLDLYWKTNREDYDGVLRELVWPLRSTGVPQKAWDAYHCRENNVEELKKNKVEILMTAKQGATIRDSTQTLNLGQEVSRQYLEAGRELACAWLNLLDQAETRPVLFLDHWDMLLDHAENDFAAWLVEDLLISLHRRRPEGRVVIASDRPLRGDSLLRQRVKGGEMVSQEVQPLAPQYAQTLMKQEGLDDKVVQALILDRFGGNPLLIKLAVDLWREQPELDLAALSHDLDVRATTDWLMVQICDNLADERTRKVLERGVVLQSFKLDTLKTVCELPGLDQSWYEDFKSRPFVQESACQQHCKGLCEFQRTVRTVQLGYLWQDDRQSFRTLHGKALDWYQSPTENKKARCRS